MTILSYGVNSGGIDALWGIMIFLSTFGVIIAIVYLVTEWFSKPCFVALLLLITILVVGILGLCFWTPHYNTLKVYNDDNFKIESVVKKYEITNTDGYIITLQERKPIE